MEFTVKWIEQDPQQNFWNIFPHDETLPRDLFIRHFQNPFAVVVPKTVSVYYALLCTGAEPAAGCIFIYFPQSGSMLIRHIFIQAAYRQELGLDGLDPDYDRLKCLFSNKASHLSDQDGISFLLRKIRSGARRDAPPVYVFAETVNVLEANTLSAEEHKRLNRLHRFYAAMKGKTFATGNYDRPKIKNEFQNAPLSLINFPEFHGEPFIVPIKAILSFVDEYRQFIMSDATHVVPAMIAWTPEMIGQIASCPKQATIEDITNIGTFHSDVSHLLLGLIEEKFPQNLPQVYLRELPRLEEAKIGFGRASICFELMVDEDYFEPENIEPEQKFPTLKDEVADIKWWQQIKWFGNFGKPGPPKKSREEKIDQILGEGYCIVHHSFETDLFAYKYQASPPFFTKNYRTGQDVTIQFPACNNFISEGRKERFYSFPEPVNQMLEMKCFINYSYFLNSRMRVWHIVFRSKDNMPISEFDIIKLMKFFSGSQESASEARKKSELEQVRFGLAGETNTYSFLSFFEKLTDVNYKRIPGEIQNGNIGSELSLLKNVNTGIVQIDAKYIDLKTLIDYLERKKINQSVLENDLARFHEDLYKKSKGHSGDEKKNRYVNIDYLLKTYCGIALGLFDFERMGGQEVGDTLQPRSESLDSDYFLTVNRGVITSYSIEDDVLNSTWDTLGINPYLVVPSAVLVHNEYVSTDADNRLTRVLERCRVDSSNAIKLDELIDERNYIDDLINDDILGNVFQYPSEQELYEYGMRHRGINDRIKDTRAKLAQLDKIIEQMQSQKSIANERTIQTVLGILSLLQIVSLVADYRAIDNDRVEDYTIISIILLFIGFLYVSLLKNTKVKIKKPKKNDRHARKL
jgi:hypothetical protein